MAHDVASAVPGLDESRLQAVREQETRRFAARTRRSAELLARARSRLPNAVPMAWLANLYAHPPLIVERGSRRISSRSSADSSALSASSPSGVR